MQKKQKCVSTVSAVITSLTMVTKNAFETPRSPAHRIDKRQNIFFTNHTTTIFQLLQIRMFLVERPFLFWVGELPLKPEAKKGILILWVSVVLSFVCAQYKKGLLTLRPVGILLMELSRKNAPKWLKFQKPHPAKWHRPQNYAPLGMSVFQS